MCTKRLQVSLPPLHIPEEIVTSILLRLPVKSHLKFKCVSKSWLSLISSSGFVKDHIKFSTKNNVYNHDRLLCGSTSLPMDLNTHSIQSEVLKYVPTGHVNFSTYQNLPGHRMSFDYPIDEPHHSLMLVGSCNGLICVSFLSMSFGTLILWNPAIRKSKILPNSGTNQSDYFFAAKFAFGYDAMHDDYKVVENLCIMNNSSGTIMTRVKVYSLRANSWKTLPDRTGEYSYGGAGMYLNGAIHWLSPKYNEMSRTIVSYDLARDTFKGISLPTFEDNDVIFIFNVLEGCLALCCDHKVHMDVWLMKEYGVRESWTKVIRIPFFCNFWDHKLLRPVPLYFFVDGRILVNYGPHLSIYDPRNPQIFHFPHPYVAPNAITYFESLVSLELDNGN